tara:strand:- start:316 stop:807 length:492 start_codon:yes stop_codon:yes gene_type:complete
MQLPLVIKVRTPKEIKAHKLYEKELKRMIKLIGHNNTTDNFELDTYGKKLFGKKYVGTHPKDLTPDLKPNQYAIINLDDSDKEGSHWVTIAKFSNGNTLFYDSFGRHSNTLGFTETYENADTSDREQQSKFIGDKIEQVTCGQRSLAFLSVCNELGYNYAKLI